MPLSSMSSSSLLLSPHPPVKQQQRAVWWWIRPECLTGSAGDDEFTSPPLSLIRPQAQCELLHLHSPKHYCPPHRNTQPRGQYTCSPGGLFKWSSSLKSSLNLKAVPLRLKLCLSTHAKLYSFVLYFSLCSDCGTWAMIVVFNYLFLLISISEINGRVLCPCITEQVQLLLEGLRVKKGSMFNLNIGSII